MSYQFRKAVRTNTSTLIALAGSSGSGKTYSALRIARGLAGTTGKIVLIDTEAGRALHYADTRDFDHLDLKPPFAPDTYMQAIMAAEDVGYGVIIADSMSHEWAGDGGCQDMHDAEHARLGGTDQTNVLAWRAPKLAHKRMISRLLQCRAHLIFCLRAEEKIKFVKVEGKTRIEPAGWQPICEKNFMYEMTVSFMLLDGHPGVGVSIKLQEQHKACFPSGALLDESAGERLAAWASGGVTRAGLDRDQHEAHTLDQVGSTPTPATTPEVEERAALIARIKKLGQRFTQAQRAKIKGAILDDPDADITKCDIAALETLARHLEEHEPH